MQEEWLPVIGYETKYCVSNLGRVRGPKGILRGGLGSYVKYPVVTLSNKTKPHGHTTKYVHHLVLKAFVGPNPDPKNLEAVHKDENCLNNRLDNLEWGCKKLNRLQAGRKASRTWAGKKKQITTPVQVGRQTYSLECTEGNQWKILKTMV